MIQAVNPAHTGRRWQEKAPFNLTNLLQQKEVSRSTKLHKAPSKGAIAKHQTAIAGGGIVLLSFWIISKSAVL